jgi:hypothetical protein
MDNSSLGATFVTSGPPSPSGSAVGDLASTTVYQAGHTGRIEKIVNLPDDISTLGRERDSSVKCSKLTNRQDQTNETDDTEGPKILGYLVAGAVGLGSIAYGLKYGVPYFKDKYGKWREDTTGAVIEAVASNQPTSTGLTAKLGRLVYGSKRSEWTAYPRDTELGDMSDRGPYTELLEMPEPAHTRPL